MRRNDSYILTEIADVPYLLPYGQMIADHKPAIRLNETGVFLWGLLEEEHSLEELVNLCANYYGMREGLEELTSDIKSFTLNLGSHGILEGMEPDISEPSCVKYLNIGGLILKMMGPSQAFSNNFEGYCIAPCEKVHQTIRVLLGCPIIKQNGTVIIRNRELIIIENTKEYVLLFPNAPQINEVHLTRNASLADFYCMPPYTERFQEDLFHAIRIAFLYLAQKHNMIAIHSASLLYQGKAWLFSAPSGTGKSTHTNLWHQLFGTPIINGDLNLLDIRNGQPQIHGMPWCGTSGISDANTYPLGGIIILKQAKEERIEELSCDRRQLSLLNRFISPFWNKDMLQQNLHFAGALSNQILVCRLHCTPKPSAAQAMKNYIDAYLHNGTKDF